MRTVTEIVSEGFIWGVGITRPKPGRERRAALFITTLVASVIVAAGALLIILNRF